MMLAFLLILWHHLAENSLKPHQQILLIHAKEGDFVPSELVLIDYDNVGYGFRIFDLMYFMSNWGYFPSADDVKAFLNSKLRFAFHSSHLFQLMSHIKHMTQH